MEGLMVVCNKLKLAAYFAYDCKLGDTYIWSTAQWGWISLQLKQDNVYGVLLNWASQIILRHFSERTLKSETQGPCRGIAEDVSVVGCNTL
jgi:hypothetical protein